MAIKQRNTYHTCLISTPDNTARMSFVPEKGGMAYSLQCYRQGQWRELLYLSDKFWDDSTHELAGGWPFLFPICGRLERGGTEGRYAYQKKYYHLPIHGFAHQQSWKVISCQDNSITLSLKSTAETLNIYPFQFEIELSYIIYDTHLVCLQTYYNHSTESMPYYAGFHPYFRVPSGETKQEVMLDFSPTHLWRYNKTLTDITGEDPLFELPVSIANPYINEKLLSLRPHSLITLYFPDKFRLSLLNDEKFSYLQLYTQLGEPFFCLEPWMSFPNALNTMEGVRWLAPGMSEKSALKLLF